MAEGIGLLNQRTMLLYHGFESLFLRANKKRLLTFFVHLLSFPFFSQKEALKKGQYPLRVISLARFIPYPKFEYVKQGCLKSSWYFKVVHWFLHNFVCIRKTRLREQLAQLGCASCSRSLVLRIQTKDTRRDTCKKPMKGYQPSLRF